MIKDLQNTLKDAESEDIEIRRIAIDYLSDLLYSKSLEVSEVFTIVNFIYNRVAIEPSNSLREELLHAVIYGMSNYDLSDRKVQWLHLSQYVSLFSGEVLAHTLVLLGGSKLRQYIPLLERYTHDSNEIIAQAAQEALVELQASTK